MSFAQQPATYNQWDATTPANSKAPSRAGQFVFDFLTATLQVAVSTGTALVFAPVSAALVRAFAGNNTVETMRDETRTVTGDLPGADGIGGRDRFRLPNDNPVTELVNAVQHVWQLVTAADGAEFSRWLVHLLAGGAQVDAITLQANTTDDDTVLVLLLRQGGAYVTKRVKQGPINSGPGGAGRAIFVDN
jgi:hypothetical protein